MVELTQDDGPLSFLLFLTACSGVGGGRSRRGLLPLDHRREIRIRGLLGGGHQTDEQGEVSPLFRRRQGPVVVHARVAVVSGCRLRDVFSQGRNKIGETGCTKRSRNLLSNTHLHWSYSLGKPNHSGVTIGSIEAVPCDDNGGRRISADVAAGQCATTSGRRYLEASMNRLGRRTVDSAHSLRCCCHSGNSGGGGEGGGSYTGGARCAGVVVVVVSRSFLRHAGGAARQSRPSRVGVAEHRARLGRVARQIQS